MIAQYLEAYPAPKQDETDKTIHPVVAPVYEALKARAAEMLVDNPKEEKAHVIGYTRIDGRLITCRLTLSRSKDWPCEQFEYYHYRYTHALNMSVTRT